MAVISPQVVCVVQSCTTDVHDMIDCRYLPQSDKKALGWSRLVTSDVCEEDEDDLYDGDTHENVLSDPAIRFVERNPASRRISVVQSPMAITPETGATTNMTRVFIARVCKLHITSVSQIARQADGVTPLYIIGEIHCIVTQLDVFPTRCTRDQITRRRCLAGNPFLARNDVVVRSSKKQIDITYYITMPCPHKITTLCAVEPRSQSRVYAPL